LSLVNQPEDALNLFSSCIILKKNCGTYARLSSFCYFLSEPFHHHMKFQWHNKKLNKSRALQLIHKADNLPFGS
jgi:hypothetical protein